VILPSVAAPQRASRDLLALSYAGCIEKSRGWVWAGCCRQSSPAPLPSSRRDFCRRALRRAPPDCSAFSLSFDASVFVIESSRRRVAVEAALENRGENAYSTVLNISFSRNLQFASLIPKVRLPRAFQKRFESRPMRKPRPKPEPKNVSVPHKSDMFMG